MRGGKIPPCDRNRLGTEIAAEHARHSSEPRTLDQLQTGAAERIPHALIFLRPGESRHARGKRRMRRGGHVVEPVRVPRIGRDARTQLDSFAVRSRMNVHRPWSLARIIQNLRAQRVRAARDLPHRRALMALRDKFETVADRAARESAEQPLRQGRCDD